jgi:hypothetical protein
VQLCPTGAFPPAKKLLQKTLLQTKTLLQIHSLKEYIKIGLRAQLGGGALAGMHKALDSLPSPAKINMQTSN